MSIISELTVSGGWELLEVRKIAQVKGGKRLPSGEEFADEITPYPYLRVTNMVNGTIKDESIVYVKPDIQKYISNYTISSNDLYVTIAGTLGQFGKIPKKYNGAQLTENAAKLTSIDLDKYDLSYLNYSLRGDFIQSQIYREIGVGSGVPKLALHRIEKLKVSLPSTLNKQKEIAKILTTTDQLIEKTQALIDKYTAIKQGMMADLFTRGIDFTTGKLRPPVEQAPHLYKEIELGWVPKDWDVRPLIDYFSYISYGFTNPMPEVNDGPYMITAANVFDGEIQYQSARHTDQKAYDTLLTKKSRPEIGDLLLTKDGTLGRLATVDRDDVCINQSVAVLRPNKLCDVSLIKHLLETEHYQKKMLNDAGGSAIKHIYITIIDKMLLGLPKQKEEQEKLLNIITNIHNTIANQKNLVNKLKLQKHGLMKDLLTGKVTVN